MRSYDITDKYDCYTWIKETLDKSQYRITQYCIKNTEFTYDYYIVEFVDEKAETMYLLRWSNRT